MDDYIETELYRRGTDCLQCPDVGGNIEVDSGGYAQPAISVVSLYKS